MFPSFSPHSHEPVSNKRSLSFPVGPRSRRASGGELLAPCQPVFVPSLIVFMPCQGHSFARGNTENRHALHRVVCSTTVRQAGMMHPPSPTIGDISKPMRTYRSSDVHQGLTADPVTTFHLKDNPPISPESRRYMSQPCFPTSNPAPAQSG